MTFDVHFCSCSDDEVMKSKCFIASTNPDLLHDAATISLSSLFAAAAEGSADDTDNGQGVSNER